MHTLSPPKPKVAASQAQLDALARAEHERCLICGAGNPLGMKVKFRVDEDGSVFALFPCRDALQSYPATLHGGVTAALLDAAMTNALFSIGIVAVTVELTVRFLAPVALNHGAVVRGAVERTSHPLYYVGARLEQNRRLMARASAKFLVKGCC